MIDFFISLFIMILTNFRMNSWCIYDIHPVIPRITSSFLCLYPRANTCIDTRQRLYNSRFS